MVIRQIDKAKRNICKIIMSSFVFIFLSLTFLCLSSCKVEKKYDSSKVPNLFGYKHENILDYLKERRYTDFELDEIRRDSAGTRLYLFNYYRNDKASIILSVSCGGRINKLTPPAKFSYLNDQEDFVAWFDDIKQGIHFKDGTTLKSPLLGMIFSSFEVDPSGKLFFIKNESKSIELASTDNPKKPLFHSRIEADKIYLKDGRVYLFGRNYRNAKGPGDYEQHEIICQVLRRADTSLELIEEIHIPRPKPSPSPFAVVDFDPWSDNVLLLDVKDEPLSFLTSWYLYDLKTKKMTKVGRANDYGFFLKEDILRHYDQNQ